ncbi:MAG: hypothetical protein KTR15_11130 [Phycisphaeraceae bacterium]|nr:hypothetical protein [Phycisphaeraceae bacterium]
MKRRPSPSSKGNKQPGYQVWHFALAVPAIAVMLQLMLGSLTPLPEEHNPYTTRYASTFQDEYDEYHNDKLPEFEILPLNLRGEMTGPILASVLQEYFPESTTQQANDLRDTLPPCDDPRMIVILPKDEDVKPVF